MKMSILFITSIFILFFSSCATVREIDQICPNVFIHSKEKLELSETEKRLICGDSEVEAYKVIPSYQASYLLTGFLQSRGYSQPRFFYEGEVLHAYSENISHVNDVIVVSENESDSALVHDEILRKYKNDILTPKLLDEIEEASLKILRNNTYPCAKVESLVDASKNLVTITISGLMPFQYGVIAKEEIAGVDAQALDRFYPFIATDYFSEKKLTLAEKRFLRSGIVQGTYFQENCQLAKKEFSLSQQFISGDSRSIRLGIGASTEVGPMVRAKWSNQRSGNMASLLEASAQVSFRNQYFNFTSDRYMWKDTPRRSLLTTFELEHDDQLNYEEFTAQLKPHIQWTRDVRSRLWTWSAGPTLIAGSYKTNENSSDTKRIKTGALEGMLETKSHEYEVYDIHPEEGDTFNFHFDFRHPSFGFDEPLLKLDFSYLKLIQLGELGKGEAVGGIRFNAATSWVKDTVDINNLPPSVKFFAGGSDDNRGFKLNSLPDNNGVGSLTRFSFKLEFRKTYVFIPTVESFTFVDSIFFGYKSWDLEKRVWYSPGTGLRWLSPIGIVQGYVARALSNETIKDNGNYFYLGLGGVF
ncbi:MAG: BamA/TamA family outer membrane protein [Bdellovibrionales bacterium]|nr:BamA/TamA family outer membrane protein [Bdellovibrionales bacterium]